MNFIRDGFWRGFDVIQPEKNGILQPVVSHRWLRHHVRGIARIIGLGGANVVKAMYSHCFMV
jgi:hypothetical protein